MTDTDPLNVKDFGAVGDGVTDDTAAVQAAIDKAQEGLDALKIQQAITRLAARYDPRLVMRVAREWVAYMDGQIERNEVADMVAEAEAGDPSDYG